QGMWGIFEVLMDTLVICTMTALVIIVTGQWNSGLQGAVLTTTAFETGFKGGSFVVAFGLTFFAFSTILGWAYYGERCMEFLFGKKSVIFYRIVFIPAIVVGSIGGLQAVWAISDTLNGLMAIPNLIAIFMLQGVVVSMVKDFFADPDYVRESHHEYISALPITEEDKKAVGNLIMK
ncbi:alanine:cation symporter family protein, partial [Filifactor alocis]